jgi:hypothetical protein
VIVVDDRAREVVLPLAVSASEAQRSVVPQCLARLAGMILVAIRASEPKVHVLPFQRFLSNSLRTRGSSQIVR